MKCTRYFLGSSSPTGFKTNFNSLISDTGYYTYIIKGGPGTGKSTLMKRIEKAFPDEDKEIYFCSSDPDSYDAVILKESKVILVDGTSPHCFDCDYPGAVQCILDLGRFWDTIRLREQKDSIVSATTDYLQYHLRCRRFIAAMAAIISDTLHIVSPAINTVKLDNFIGRLSKKLFPKKTAGEGNTYYKQLSSISPNGYITNIPDDNTVYLLDDSHMAGSDYFLRKLASDLTGKGYDIEVSLCNVQNEENYEHLRVPELSIVFLTSTIINNLTLPVKKPVNFLRFYDKNIIHEKKSRLKFNASAVKNLQNEAVCSLKNAKESHDKLEKYYTEAVEFGGIDELVNVLVSDIKSIS